jgi:hypothetical protein
MPLPCKLKGSFVYAPIAQGIFKNTIKLRGVFRDEIKKGDEERPIKLKGTLVLLKNIKGVHDNQKSNGVFLNLLNKKGHLDFIKLNGKLLISTTTLILSGEYIDQIKKEGSLIENLEISGLFSCVPSSKACTAYNLDFYYSCNSSHLVSAGF